MSLVQMLPPSASSSSASSLSSSHCNYYLETAHHNQPPGLVFRCSLLPSKSCQGYTQPCAQKQFKKEKRKKAWCWSRPNVGNSTMLQVNTFMHDPSSTRPPICFYSGFWSSFNICYDASIMWKRFWSWRRFRLACTDQALQLQQLLQYPYVMISRHHQYKLLDQQPPLGPLHCHKNWLWMRHHRPRMLSHGGSRN